MNIQLAWMDSSSLAQQVFSIFNFKNISIIYYCRFMFLVSLIFRIGEKFQNKFPLSCVQDPSSYLKLMTGISWMLQVSPSSRPARILAKNPRISGLKALSRTLRLEFHCSPFTDINSQQKLS